MKSYPSVFIILLIPTLIFSQFSPAANQQGSTAIYKDSSIFVSWADSIILFRGKEQISEPNSPLASFGLKQNALYKAEGNSMDVVSLGDSGVAILYFNPSIYNGDGYDFAIFENAFDDNLLELAFVEVSSDGIYYARFPAQSNTPLNPQLTGFEYADCSLVHHLAGKYRQGYGTPFDLDEINDPNVDVNHISHIKIIDVIGDVSGTHSSYDMNNQIINDPYPTPFPSSGFDLDGIGVIHQNHLSISVKNSQENLHFYPNPVISELHIHSKDYIHQIFIYQSDGKILEKTFFNQQNHITLTLSHFCKGLYFIEIDNHVYSIIKED